MRIACIGEAMVELSLDAQTPDRARIGFAGDVLNTAIYLKRAAPRLRVDFVTRLGRDSFSARMRDFIDAEGVGTAAIETDRERRVGLYAIETDDHGERSFTYWRDRSAARAMFQTGSGPDFSALEDYDLIYLSGITLAILPSATRSEICGQLAAFRRKGGKVAFDSNYRPVLWPDTDTARAAIGCLWRECDFALPSLDDEQALFGDADAAAVIARMREHAIANGALKRGANGPLSLGDAVSDRYDPAPQVVDTTAAGDSFNGGYLGTILTGGTQAEALQAGHRLAARVVGAKGAIVPT